MAQDDVESTLPVCKDAAEPTITVTVVTKQTMQLHQSSRARTQAARGLAAALAGGLFGYHLLSGSYGEMLMFAALIIGYYYLWERYPAAYNRAHPPLKQTFRAALPGSRG